MWIEEEASTYASSVMKEANIATDEISDIKMLHAIEEGQDLTIEIVAIGNDSTSYTFSGVIKDEFACVVAKVDRLVYASVDEKGLPREHGIEFAEADEGCPSEEESAEIVALPHFPLSYRAIPH